MGQLNSLAIPLFFLMSAAADVPKDDAVVKEFLQAYVDAFNKQDLDATSAMWAENCSYVNRESGERTKGRTAIRADLQEVFKNPLKTHLAGTVDLVRSVKPDLVSVEGRITTSVPDEQPSELLFAALLAKQGDNWLIQSVEEMTVPQPLTAGDALQQLAWLEGNWVDNSKDSPVVSTIRWSANESFLIRSFSTQEGEEVTPLGTQIIGWDPRSQQIRSWTFNVDGSFGDGIWSQVDNDWSIQSTQTLADGRAASGTYVVTRVDENTVTLKLVGQEIDGEPVPASDPVSLVRVPEAKQPVQAAPQPSK
jgi:uncharacterized protein (TIGR02246 family)